MTSVSVSLSLSLSTYAITIWRQNAWLSFDFHEAGKCPSPIGSRKKAVFAIEGYSGHIIIIIAFSQAATSLQTHCRGRYKPLSTMRRNSNHQRHGSPSIQQQPLTTTDDTCVRTSRKSASRNVKVSEALASFIAGACTCITSVCLHDHFVFTWRLLLGRKTVIASRRLKLLLFPHFASIPSESHLNGPWVVLLTYL